MGGDRLLCALRHGLRLRRVAAGISRIGANNVLVYQYLVTVTGIVFFGEVLGIEKIVGGTVILLGVYLARRQ